MTNKENEMKIEFKGTVGEATKKNLIENGVKYILFTFVWYNDETSLWNYPECFNEADERVEVNRDANIYLNDVIEEDGYEVCEGEGGEFQWDVGTGNVKLVRNAYVSEPELFYD
jgi:arginine deiminase